MYAPGASATIGCTGAITFAEFEAQDLDPGTQQFDSATLNISTIIQWGRDVLGMD